MGDGSSTKTGLIGEDAAGNAFLYGSEHSANDAAGDCSGIKGAFKNRRKRGGQIFDMHDDNATAQHDVQQCHNGNQTLRYAANPLDAAQQDQAHQNGDNNTKDQVQGSSAISADRLWREACDASVMSPFLSSRS